MSVSVATLGMGTWELVDRVERLHGDVTVVRRCLELSELLACSHTGMADVALVAEGAEDLTVSLLEQLAGNGVRVLAVEGFDSARLSRLGVPGLPASATGHEVARAVQRVAAGAAPGPAAVLGGLAPGDGSVGADGAILARGADGAREPDGAHGVENARRHDGARGSSGPRGASSPRGTSRAHGADGPDETGGTRGGGGDAGPRARRTEDASSGADASEPHGRSPSHGRARPGDQTGSGDRADSADRSRSRSRSGASSGAGASTAQQAAGAGFAGSSAADASSAGDGARENPRDRAASPAGPDDAAAGADATDGGGWEPDAGVRGQESRGTGGTPRGIVAVWGPAGSPGRTVTAVNLAAEAALRGVRVLLVDADTCAASVAASLGMLDEAAGLAQACRLADQGRMDDAGLRRCVTAVSVAGASMDVLSGITRHDRWPEIRGSALEIVLERARGDYDLVVVDVAASLESDEEITTDFLAPRRNAAALCAVAAADTVVALGSADALGVPRLVKALPDLLEAAPEARVVVVVTKLRSSAAGRSAADAVREAWDRFSPGHPVAHTLPWDPGSCDEALLAGAVLAETAARTALRSAVAELVGLLAEESEAPGRRVAGAGGTGARGTRLGRRMGAWLRRG